MLTVVTINEAIKTLEENFKNYKIDIEEVEILDSQGKVLAEDIVSKENIPNFNRSTVDGYAIRAQDSFGASESIPSLFKVVGEVKMGEPADCEVGYGEAVYVPTGGMVPEGANSVVMIEYVEKLDEIEIAVEKSLAPLENVVSIGEDINTGETVLKAGHKIRSQDIGGLAGLGITKVKTFKDIKIGILSTGDEIVEPQKELKFGQIRDINSYTLASAGQEDGCSMRLYGIVKDEYDILKEKMKQALSESDIVLVSGGSSVGMKDATSDVINSLGEPGVLIHGLQTKPGKPTIIGNIGGKAVIGLPGHPAAALMIYKVIVARLIKILRGQEQKESYVTAQFTQNYGSAHGREEYVMVELHKVDNKIAAKPIYAKSALIGTMIKADGYVRIEANKEGLYENETVEVNLF